jgi:hypothetical protein
MTKTETIISKADLTVFEPRPQIIFNMYKQSLNPAECGGRSQNKLSTKRRALCFQKQQFPLTNENTAGRACRLLCILILFRICSFVKTHRLNFVGVYI